MGNYRVHDRRSEQDKEGVEFYLERLNRTEFAIQFTDGVEAVWIARSQIMEMEHIKGFDFRIVIPRWLAKAKEMI